MSQLDALTVFVKANMQERAFQGFSSHMDEMKFIPAQKELGLNQRRIAVIQYTGLLAWDRFPYRLCDPRELAALCLAWLMESDRELFEEMGIDNDLPDFEIDLIDEETAVLVVSVPMVEALNVVRDEKGAIPMDGERWKLEDPEIWIASQALIYGVDSQGAKIGPEK